jgi:hypothetical protein
MILHRNNLMSARCQLVKQFFAVLFSLLLVLGQFAPAQASRGCKMSNAVPCRMACCAAKQSHESQPAPAVPPQSNVQSQLSFLAPAVVVCTLPENSANLISSASASPSLAMTAPLYARDCALLL